MLNKKVDANKITPEEESEEEKGSTAKTKKSSQKKHRSVLQIKLGKLAVQIGYGGMLGALFTFLILIFRMAIEEFAVHQRSWSNLYIKYIISYLIQAITVIVVAVPEGLPLAVTLALAFAVRVRRFLFLSISIPIFITFLILFYFYFSSITNSK